MGLAVCPLKSHEDYQRLLQLVNKDDDQALYIYDQLGERTPSPQELTLLEKGGRLNKYHNQRAWDVNKAEKLVDVTSWKTINGFSRPDPVYFFRKRAEDLAEQLKLKYKDEQISFTALPVEGSTKYIIKSFDKRFVDDKDHLEYIHILNNEARQETEEGAITDESRRLTNIPTESETMEGMRQKIAVLKKAIPFVENVIIDDTIGSVAMLEAGGKTIRINSRLMTTDSIGHEYGHVLIDLIGGMTNHLVRQGREQLKGTDIERAVIERYPDLASRNDDRLDKEIVTTAVGLKVAELFKDQEKQSKWLRWLIRFFRNIRAKLGMESSAVLKLAERLVSEKQLKTKEYSTTTEIDEGLYIKGRPSFYEQYSRQMENGVTLLDKMIIAEEQFQDKAAFALQKKLEVYAKRGKETVEYQALEELMPKLQGTNPTKSLIHMLKFALRSTKEMNDHYIAYLKAEQDGKEETRGRFTAKLLSEWKNSAAAWNMLDDLKQLYVNTRNQVDALGTDVDKKIMKDLFFQNKALLESIVGEEKLAKMSKGRVPNLFDLLIPILDEAINIKNTIQDLYVEKGKELMVDFLFPYVNHVKIIKKEQYEKEWLALKPEEQKALSKAEYITQKLQENMEQIETDTRDLILRELEKAEGDVGVLTRYVDTILDSKDVISSALARAVYDIHDKSSQEQLKWKRKFMVRLEALEKQQGRTPSMPDEKFWEWMYETDVKSGLPMHNIISALPSQLINDYWEQHEMIWSSTYKDNNGNKVSDYQKHKLLRTWKETHAPRDREAWLKAQAELAEDLHAQGKITEKEKTRFINNSKLTTKAVRQPLTKIFSSQDVIDIVDSFYHRNEWNYRNPSGYYKQLNTKWDALQAMRKNGLKNGVQTDERVLFYDFITEVIDTASSMIPGKYALTTELPSMMKALGQKYRATAAFGMSKTDFLKRHIASKLRKQRTDTDRGLLDAEDSELNSVGKEEKEKQKQSGNEGAERTELVNEAGDPIYFLPIYYTQNKAREVGKKMSIQDQSYDIASLYFNYLAMAIDFSNKYNVLAEIEMTNFFLKNRDVIRRDARGNIITDATAKKLRKPIEDIRDKALTRAGTQSLIAAQTDDFIKSHIYGLNKEEEPDVNIFGFTVDRAKALDAVNRFTALNLLGVNFIAGFANLNLGEITQLTESFAGQYTTVKDLHAATKYYYKNLGGIVKDIGTRQPENIVNVLNERFNTLNEEIDGKINLNSRFANLMKTNTLFFTSHMGEHYMQTRFMLAMLKTMRAFDSSGKDIGSMLDYLSVDIETGGLKVDEKVINFTEKDQTDFSAKMHRVLSKLHGEYSKLGSNALERQAIGRMAILFRRFIVPGFKRRWEGKVPNNLLGESTEGYYRTFGRFAKQFMSDFVHFRFEAMSALGNDKLTDLERANLIRFTGEMVFLALMIISTALLLRMKDNDDDKDDFMLNNLAYQALRLKSEMMFYFNPMATMQIMRSPAAAMSSLENTFKLIGQLMHPITSGSLFTNDEGFLGLELYEQGNWKGHLKIEKTFSNIIPVYKQAYRIRDIEDQLSWFQQ